MKKLNVFHVFRNIQKSQYLFPLYLVTPEGLLRDQARRKEDQDSGTRPRVLVSLGLAPCSYGLGPCSKARAWGVLHNWKMEIGMCKLERYQGTKIQLNLHMGEC